MGEVPTRKHPTWRNRTSDRESDGRFWIEKSEFLFEFPCNHTSISPIFGDKRVCQTDRQTDRQTTRTNNIAGLQIVAGQLIIDTSSKERRQFICQSILEKFLSWQFVCWATCRQHRATLDSQPLRTPSHRESFVSEVRVFLDQMRNAGNLFDD